MKTSIARRLMNLIEIGRKGGNMGLSTGLPKLDKLIYGVQRKWLTVLAASSGGGKTSLAIYSYVYQPLKQMLGDPKLKIIYFSLEVSSEILFAKLLVLHILDEYKIKLDYKEILSLGTSLSDEKYALILKSQEWLAQVEQHLIIYDKPVNADGVNEFLLTYLKTNGEFSEPNPGQILYKSFIKDHFTIVVIDHVRLLTGKPKEEIDKVCDYLVFLRNVAELSVVLIQQINRDSQSMDRRKAGFNMFQLSDLADSSAPAQSAETVLGLFHPFREQLANCCEYDITQLGDNSRILQCLKSRYGESDKAIGLTFFGSVGAFKEMPQPNEIRDYNTYKNIAYYLDDKKEIIEKKNPFDFSQ